MSVLQINPAVSIQFSEERALVDSPQGLFQLSGGDVSVFIRELLTLVDGSRSLEELLKLLPGYEPESVQRMISLLQQKKILIEGEGEGHRQHSEIDLEQFQEFELKGKEALKKLASAHIMVIGLEPWAMNAVIELARLGVRKFTLLDDQLLGLEEGAAIHFTGNKFAGTPRYEIARRMLEEASGGEAEVLAATLPKELLSTQADLKEVMPKSAPSLILNAVRYEELLLRYQVSLAAYLSHVPSLSTHMEGNEVWVGPLHEGDETACWNCLRMRRLAMDDQILQAHQTQAQLMSQRPAPIQRDWLIPIAREAGKLIAHEVLGVHLNPKSQHLHGRVRISDLLKNQDQVHGFARLPWCPLCGGAQVSLEKARMAKIDISGAEERPAEDLPTLLTKMNGWLDPRFGIIRSLEVSPIGPPLPLNGSTRMANYTEGDPSRSTPGANCGGKGVTAFQAQVSALGETVERYSAARYRERDLTLAKMGELEGDVIDPRELSFYAPSVYQDPNNPYVPFDPNVAIRWVEGHWFGSDEKVWVPAIATYFGLQATPQEQLLQVTSNGLAAGANSADAALRAVFELIERDATMLTWFCQLPAQEIILDSSLDEKMRQTVKYIEGQGYRLKVYLLNVDVDIPVIFCLGFGDGRVSPSVAASLACHGDLRVAVDKALLEQAQVLPYLSSIPIERVPQTREQVRTLEDHAFYYVQPGRESAFAFLDGDKPPLSLCDVPRNEFPKGAAEATKVIASQLKQAGLKIATVDLTSPDTYETPFRVARAVGANVQPIHFGYHLRPTQNPRLQKLLGSRTINPNPHPIA